MTRKASLITAFILLGIISTCGWIVYQIAVQPYKHSKQPNKPDGIVRNVTYTSTNNQGQLQARFTSPQVTHIPNHKVALFKFPKIVVYPHNKPLITITADNGKSINGSKTVYLKNNIVIHEAATKKNHGFTMHTQQLVFYPKQHLVKTKDRITVTQANMKTIAIGMIANTKTGNVKLLSHIHTRYIPKKGDFHVN